MDLGEGYGDTGDHFSVTDDGEVIYTTVQEGYKEGIEWLHKLVTEDLVDPEAFTQEWSTYVAKGKNHRYGLCFTWDIANIDNNTDYVMLPALTEPTGVTNITRQNNSETSGFDRGRCVLTTSCKDTALAICLDRSDVCTGCSHRRTTGEAMERKILSIFLRCLRMKTEKRC